MVPEHYELLRAVIEHHGGRVIKTMVTQSWRRSTTVMNRFGLPSACSAPLKSSQCGRGKMADAIDRLLVNLRLEAHPTVQEKVPKLLQRPEAFGAHHKRLLSHKRITHR